MSTAGAATARRAPWWRQPRLVAFYAIGGPFAALAVFLVHAVVAPVMTVVRGGSSDDVTFADPWAVTITLTLFTAIAAGAWYASRRARRRRREVERWAAAHGWSTDVKRSTLSGRWDAPPFDRASGQPVCDAVQRVDGRGAVFSFTYRCSGNRHVVMTERAMFGPGIRLTPEGPADRVALALGGQDITVEWQAFNARWRIESRHPRFTHAVLHPRLMERLMEPDTEGLSVLVEGSDVVVHAPGCADLERIEPMAALVLDLAELLPRFVVDDHPRVSARTRREVQWRRADRWRR